MMASFNRGYAPTLFVALFGLFLSTVAVSADKDGLKELWSALEASDRTTIKVASAKLGSQLTTPQDSPNGRFWAALAKEGYLESVDLADVYGEAAVATLQSAGFKVYRVNFEGARKLPGLLKELGGE